MRGRVFVCWGYRAKKVRGRVFVCWGYPARKVRGRVFVLGVSSQESGVVYLCVRGIQPGK